MRKTIKFLFAALLVTSLLGSCVSYKNVPYFQDLDSIATLAPTAVFQQARIQKNDLIGIYISSLDVSGSSLFGAGLVEGQDAANQGFLVDSNGEVQLPTIGRIKVDDLTTLDAAKVIEEKVAFYVKEPKVTVRIRNFKVSINGEVAKPGVYPVENEKINILEAISLAGDMKITGKRENVLIIRQHDGKTEFARLDMRSKNIFKSPYYYLKNNDLVYVEPNIQRLERDDNIYKNTSLIVSIATALSLILFRLR